MLVKWFFLLSFFLPEQNVRDKPKMLTETGISPLDTDMEDVYLPKGHAPPMAGLESNTYDRS